MVEDHGVVRKDGVQPPLVANMDSGMSLGTAPASRGARAGIAGSAGEGGEGLGRGVSCEARRDDFIGSGRSDRKAIEPVPIRILCREAPKTR